MCWVIVDCQFVLMHHDFSFPPYRVVQSMLPAPPSTSTRVNFPDLGSEGFIKVDLVVVGSRWWDVVGGFL